MIAADARRNPFATRHVRPGRLEYVFPPGESMESILARWHANGCRGAIIGPHGTGKSTLLAELLAAVATNGDESTPALRAVALHDGQRRLPAGFALPKRGDAPGVVAIDGYEQLGWFARRLLLRAVHRSGWGLLVTAHDACGLPIIHRTEGSLAVTRQLVSQLLRDASVPLMGDADIQAAHLAHAGNVRETLFALYDVWEARRHLPTAPSSIFS